MQQAFAYDRLRSELVPIRDARKFLVALAQLAQLGAEFLQVCQCGWAGPRGLMQKTFVRSAAGSTDYLDYLCPDCGQSYLQMPMVAPAGRDFDTYNRALHLELDEKRARNRLWVKRIRKVVRCCDLLERQAQVEEPINPGTAAKFAELRRVAEAALAQAGPPMPPVMLRPAGKREVTEFAQRKLVSVTDRLRSPAFDYDVAPVTDILPVVRELGPTAFGRALLGGQVPAESAWSTWRWLELQGCSVTPGGWAGHAFAYLDGLSGDERRQAGKLHRDLLRLRQANEETLAVTYARVTDQWSRLEKRWLLYGQAADVCYGLHRYVVGLVQQVVAVEVQVEIQVEVARLVMLVQEHARKSGQRPVDVAADWVRAKSTFFTSRAHIALVAYPLRQTLEAGMQDQAAEVLAESVGRHA